MSKVASHIEVTCAILILCQRCGGSRGHRMLIRPTARGLLTMYAHEVPRGLLGTQCTLR